MPYDIGQILKTQRNQANMTVRKISDILTQKGFKASESTIYSWENGNSQPTPGAFLTMCSAYGIKNILITFGYDGYNEDENIRLNMSEQDHIKKYRDLDTSGRELVDYVLNHEYTRHSQLDEVEEESTIYNVRPLRLSEQPASAGRGTYLGPEAFRTIMVQKNDLTDRALFAVPVSGNSMEPTYHDGDILIVEKAEEIRMGEIGIFTLDGEGYVKEFGEDKLISLNPEYDPIPLNESVVLNGKVSGILEPEWIVER